MKKLKRIIVGIDIFSQSDDVLKRALMIAKENSAELFIVHAIETLWIEIADYFDLEELVVDKESIKKEIKKKVQELNKNIKVDYTIFVRDGDSEDVILYKSKLFKADMIIIGAHTKSKTKRNILGTTAHKVAHQSSLPVLIVKNSVVKSYKNILAPTDFAIQSKQSIIFAKNIFQVAKIKAVHAYETYYEEDYYNIKNINILKYNRGIKAYSENALEKFLQDIGIDKGEVIDAKREVNKILLEYISKDNYDLIVVGSRATAGFKALLGSVAFFILREVSNDILVYVPSGEM